MGLDVASPLVVEGILRNLRGHRQKSPGVWYSLKLSASPTLENSFELSFVGDLRTRHATW